MQAGIPGIVAEVKGGCPIDRHDFGCNGGGGNTVKVRVADGTCAGYAHLETIAVREGQAVPRGAVIGTVGSTGRATGPHLHYVRAGCWTGEAVPSSFVEAGVPQQGTDVTSALPRF